MSLRWLILAARHVDPQHADDAHEVAERVVGAGLLALAVYVVAGAAYQLVTRSRPDATP